MSHIISTPVARLSRRAPSARTGTLALAAATATTLVSWLVARRFAALDVRLHAGGSAEHVGAATAIAVTSRSASPPARGRDSHSCFRGRPVVQGA